MTLAPLTPRSAPRTANQRFKARSAQWTRLGMLIAVGLHFAVFMLVQPFAVEDLSAAEEVRLELIVPPVDLPQAPPPIDRPAAPVETSLEVDPDVTIGPTTFDDFAPRAPTPPEIARERARVRFIPYDTRPVLQNREAVAEALETEYPRDLRRAGTEGRVLLWLYVSEEGRVIRTEIKESSGVPRLDAAARRVAGLMRFSPARNRDRVTAVWVQQWVTFVAR